MKNFPFERCGRTYWYSRSVVCSAYVFAKVNNEVYILMTQRGPSQSSPGVWNVPGGFLDFDEDLEGCAIRETKEETGVDVEHLSLYNINSTPTGKLQHIIASYYTMLTLDELPAVTNKFNEPDETSDIRWIPLKDVVRYKILTGQRKMLWDCYIEVKNL